MTDLQEATLNTEKQVGLNEKLLPSWEKWKNPGCKIAGNGLQPQQMKSGFEIRKHALWQENERFQLIKKKKKRKNNMNRMSRFTKISYKKMGGGGGHNQYPYLF